MPPPYIPSNPYIPPHPDTPSDLGILYDPEILPFGSDTIHLAPLHSDTPFTPDAPYDPGALASLRAALAGGLRSGEAVRALAQSHRGYPSMVRLLLSWGDATWDAEIATWIESQIAARFRAPLADAALSRGRPPRWLRALLWEPRWRALLLQLSVRHPDSLLLAYAARSIATKAPAAAIAAVPAAGAVFGVANRLLRWAAAAPQPCDRVAAARGLSGSEHVWLYAQAVCTAVARRGGPAFACQLAPASESALDLHLRVAVAPKCLRGALRRAIGGTAATGDLARLLAGLRAGELDARAIRRADLMVRWLDALVAPDISNASEPADLAELLAWAVWDVGSPPPDPSLARGLRRVHEMFRDRPLGGALHATARILLRRIRHPIVAAAYLRGLHHCFARGLVAAHADRALPVLLGLFAAIVRRHPGLCEEALDTIAEGVRADTGTEPAVRTALVGGLLVLVERGMLVAAQHVAGEAASAVFVREFEDAVRERVRQMI